MITAHLNHQEKPVALIVGQSNFVGYFLKEALGNLHCQPVLVEAANLAKLDLDHFDYCFYLSEKGEVGLLHSLANLTQKFSGKLLVGGGKYFNQKELEDLGKWPKLDYRWVIWKEVYGPKMALTDKSFTSRLIGKAVEGGTMMLANDGSDKIYPLFVADLIYQLTRLLFAPRTKGRVYQVQGPAISCLSATLEAQKLAEGRLRINFIKEAKKIKLGQKEERILMKESTEWQEGLKTVWEYFQKRQEEKPLLKIEGKNQEVVVKQRLLGKRKWIWQALLIGLLVAGVAVIYPAGQCYFRLRQMETAFKMGNFGQMFTAAQGVEGNCRWVQKVSKKVQAGKDLANLLEKNKKVYEELNRLGEIIFQEKSLGEEKRLAEMEQVTTVLKPQLKNLYEDLSLLNYGEMLSAKLADNLTQARKLVLELSRVIEYVSEMTGKDQNKSYLILLQNNNELRPTGGFIGSVAVVTFGKGRLIDFEVKDVYALDGQLKGHVEPPPELKKYLGEANWYLRDVNWEADFPLVAMKAKWFLEKETGRQVDGVVGFNLTAAQKLMTVVGETEVNDFGEKITAQNLFERAEYHSEINFFPGSTQKQDFLGGLAKAVFDRMLRLKGQEGLALWENFYQSLQEKEILLYVDQAQIQSALTNLNWHGGWQSDSCRQAENRECLNDYLMLVEANVGVNKANYFVSRKTTLTVKVEEFRLASQVILDYQNESPAAAFPGGDYKNYLRLVLPFDVKLGKVTIGGIEVDRTLISETKVKDRLVVGWPVEVPIKQKRQVVVEYSRDINPDWQKPQQYFLLVQKQSGTKEEILDLRLTPGVGLVAFQFKPEARVDKGGYILSRPFNQDVNFEAYLTK